MFSLAHLTPNLLLQVLRRMEIKSLCRLRLTCKMLDNFAESYRFQISTRREDSHWVLCIYTTYDKCLKFSIDNRKSIDFGEALYRIGEQPCIFGLRPCYISDPYLQLSAVSLRAVHLFDYKSQRPNPDPFLHEDVPPLLHRLRLHVDWFFVFCECTPALLSTVDFLRLRVQNGFLSLKELIPMGIQNCRELAFRTDEEHNFSVCSQLFSYTETLSLDFFDTDEFIGFMKTMITSLQQDGTLLGVLKTLRIIGRWWIPSGLFDEYKFTDVEPFYTVQIKKIDYECINFYKIPFNGGFAIAVYAAFFEKKSEDDDALTFSLKNGDFDFGDAEFFCGSPEEAEDTDYVLSAPFSQLSAISLQAVLLLSKNCKPDCRHLTSDLPAVLRPFKFHVNWLYLFCNHTQELFSSVDFRRLRLENEKDVESVPTMGIEHCKEVALRTDEDYDFSVCKPLFSHIETISIDTRNSEQCERFIKPLITSFQHDENARGVLKLFRALQFWENGEIEKFKFTDVEPFHRLQVTDSHRFDFYRIPIKGGFAIAVHGLLSIPYLELRFVRECTRETLLIVLWRYLSPILPTDEDFDNFLAAQSDQEAIDSFYRVNKKSIHFVEESLKPQLIRETYDCHPLQRCLDYSELDDLD